MKRLIVTADDFGLTKGISEGIVKALKGGIVTAINLLPSGPSFEESLHLLEELKLEEIGAHLCLTDTAPVTYPGRVPTLVDKSGRFHKNYGYFFMNFFLNRISREEMYLELRNQLDRLKGTGIPVTNLTSHQHIHMMPALTGIFVDLAREYNIPFIRCLRGDRLVPPMRPEKFFKLGLLRLLGDSMVRAFGRAGLRVTDHLVGFLDSGNLNEGVLLRLLGRLEDGTTEMVCHPGFVSSEFSAFTSRRVRKFMQDNGIEPVTYKKLLSEGGR